MIFIILFYVSEFLKHSIQKYSNRKLLQYLLLEERESLKLLLEFQLLLGAGADSLSSQSSFHPELPFELLLPHPDWAEGLTEGVSSSSQPTSPPPLDWDPKTFKH